MTLRTLFRLRICSQTSCVSLCTKHSENSTAKPTCSMSYFGISKSDAEKRNIMWKKSGFGARGIIKANGKYVVYLEYHRNTTEVDGSPLFPE
jgi:hypothetical protein